VRGAGAAAARAGIAGARAAAAAAGLSPRSPPARGRWAGCAVRHRQWRTEAPARSSRRDAAARRRCDRDRAARGGRRARRPTRMKSRVGGWLLVGLIGLAAVVYRPVWNGGLVWGDTPPVTRASLPSTDGPARLWAELGAS